MSILIKGMEMPKCCGDCPCSYYTTDGVLHNFCQAVGYHTKIEYDESCRPDWCPLVALPEKHGRLIDADALAERLQLFVDWCRDDRRAGVDFVLNCPLPNISTIIEAEGGGEGA